MSKTVMLRVVVIITEDVHMNWAALVKCQNILALKCSTTLVINKKAMGRVVCLDQTNFNTE